MSSIAKSTKIGDGEELQRACAAKENQNIAKRRADLESAQQNAPYLTLGARLWDKKFKTGHPNTHSLLHISWCSGSIYKSKQCSTARENLPRKTAFRWSQDYWWRQRSSQVTFWIIVIFDLPRHNAEQYQMSKKLLNRHGSCLGHFRAASQFLFHHMPG